MPRILSTISIPAQPIRNRAARATQRSVRFGHRTEQRGGARNAFRADLDEYLESLDGSEAEPQCASTPFCGCLSCVCERKDAATFAEWRTEDEMDSDWALDRGEDPLYWLDDRYAKYVDREREAEALVEAERLEHEWVYGDLLEHILEEVLASSPEMYEKLVRGSQEAWHRAVDREMSRDV